MSFECSICNTLFSSKQRLEYHTKHVCNQKDMNCMICNKVFTKKQSLEYHVTNKVCRLADDATSKMFEMFDMIKALQKRVSILEQDNKELKDRLGILLEQILNAGRWSHTNTYIKTVAKMSCWSKHLRDFLIYGNIQKTK